MIEVEGIKSITDTLISIYNQDGIKASALFDKQIYYTQELAIPIKYLGLSINNPAKLSYHIKLNGAVANNATIRLIPNGRFYLVSGGGGPDYLIIANSQNLSYAYPTDFWGEYKLAKK